MTPESSGELSSHLTSGAVIVYLIEWLKRTRLAPWISDYTGTLNRVTSALLAAIAVLGITWAYDAATGDLVIHNLRLATILVFAWEWAKQFVLQQVLYDGIVQKSGSTKESVL